jgi:hypothetical protein
VKNHDFTPKNHIFSNCRGRRENCWGKWEKMARNYNILDIFRVVCETATRLYKYIVRVFPRADPGGARTRRPPPPKIGKNMIFWRKIVIFHTKYPKNFRASLCNWKKYDFLA